MSKLTKAAIDLFIGVDSTTINIYDRVSGLQILQVKLTPEQLSSALSKMGFTTCDVTVMDGAFDKINKKLIVDKHVFEIPNYPDYVNKHLDEIYEIAKSTCPDGWEPDNYFGSQYSFFTKEDKKYARCTIRKWVEDLVY